MSKSVRTRILAGDDTLTVREIVLPELMKPLPLGLRDEFGDMRIEWMPNRAWGLSFALGEERVRLGHRRGDHLAMYPRLTGYTDAEATRVLRVQIGGTLLHELGHAVLDAYLEQHPTAMQEVMAAALKDGVFSDYRGMTGDAMPSEDAAHEMWAEAFRYLLHGDARMARTFPHWKQFYAKVLAYLQTKYAHGARENVSSIDEFVRHQLFTGPLLERPPVKLPRGAAGPWPYGDLDSIVAQVVASAVEAFAGNVRAASRALKVSHTTTMRWLAKYATAQDKPRA